MSFHRTGRSLLIAITIALVHMSASSANAQQDPCSNQAQVDECRDNCTSDDGPCGDVCGTALTTCRDDCESIGDACILECIPACAIGPVECVACQGACITITSDCKIACNEDCNACSEPCVAPCDDLCVYCDAGGPYTEECSGSSTDVQLDGSGSFSPSGAVTLLWSGGCPGTTFSDDTANDAVATVPSAPGCDITCTVQLTVTNEAGGTATCDGAITIDDTQPPQVGAVDKIDACYPDLASARQAACDETLSKTSEICDRDPTCDSYYSPPEGVCEVMIFTTVYDDCEHSTGPTTFQTIVDDQPPTLYCPVSITVERGDKLCGFEVQQWLDSASAEDNCPGVEVTNDAPECGFAPGTHTVTFTATDACGLTSSCESTITVDPYHRVDSSSKGSLLAFSKVEIKWDASGNLTQDTFLDFANDADAGGVDVQAYFINGDIALEEIALNDGTVVQEGEPGWNSVDCRFHLTKNQPHYWSAANGSSLCQAFTILDQDGPGRPDPETGGRILRGYVVMWAVRFNPEGNYYEEIRWNHLKGDALIVNYAEGSAWEYNAWAAQTRCNMQGEPPLDCTLFDANGVCCEAEAIPGRLDLDGFQYDVTFDKLLLDFYGTGSQALSRTGAGPIDVSLDTDLTLHVMDIDLRQDGFGPVLTKAEFEVFNQNESKLSGLRRCICCWDQEWFSEYVRHAGIPNYFLRHLLGTDKGQARIDGVASTECDYLETCGMEPRGPIAIPCVNGDCLPPEGGTAGAMDGYDFSQSAALLGLAMKHLTFEGATQNEERAGMNLVGVGEQWVAPEFRIEGVWLDNVLAGKRGSTILIDVISGTGEARIAPRSAGRDALRSKTTSDADRELKAKLEANRLRNSGR